MARISFIFLYALLLHVQSFGACAETSSVFIVLMDTALMPRVFVSQHQWYKNTLSMLSETSEAPEMLYTTIGDFSAVPTSSQRKKIKKSLGYITSLRDKGNTVTTHSSNFLDLNSNSGARPQSNYGKGIIISVLDTGIWSESMNFSDQGMDQVLGRWRGGCHGGENFNSSLCNKKLIGARVFINGVKAKNEDLDIKYSARDSHDYGIHVASTVAGNYVDGDRYFGYASRTAIGVAPRAHVAMYKIGFDLDTTDSDVLAGIDQAMGSSDQLSELRKQSYPSLLHESGSR